MFADGCNWRFQDGWRAVRMRGASAEAGVKVREQAGLYGWAETVEQMKRHWRWIGALALGLLAALPEARALGDAAWGYSYDFTHDWIQSDLARRSARAAWEQAKQPAKGRERAASAKTAPRSPLDIGKVGSTAQGGLSDMRATEALAARLYPREEFVRRQIMFEKLILAFNRNVQAQYGVPANNLATAMAAALAGGWAAYTGQAFAPALVRPLVKQLEEVMRQDAELRAMHIRDKVLTYHTLVATGMWLAALQMDVQRQPDAARSARLRQLGGDYLERLLGVVPARVRFTAEGMQIH